MDVKGDMAMVILASSLTTVINDLEQEGLAEYHITIVDPPEDGYGSSS